jgi:HK97 family phage portal protein
MSAAVFNLTSRKYESAALARFIASRDGASERIASAPAIAAIGENSSQRNLTIDELANILGAAGANSAAGIPVNAETAMRVSTVYGCVALIAGAISTLPFNIYEREGQQRKQVDHDYWWMLNEQPNQDMTAAAAWEILLTGKLFYGDGFAELLRPSRSSARVIGWRPHHPLQVQPLRDERGIWYWRIQPARGEAYTLDWADVIQLPSLGFDPDCMLSPSPITYAARESVGTAIAAERYHGQFFNGGATFDYALKTPNTLDKVQRDNLLASLLARRGGANRSPLILTGGLEPAQLSVNPKDAEILATRLFTVEEICRIFGVPPHMVGHTEKNSSWGTGMEAQGSNFVRYTLLRHLVPLAQEFNRKLWPSRQRFFVEHDTTALVRGDIKTRFDAYRVAMGRAGEMPWMEADEVRRLENLPPNPNLKPNGGTSAQPTDPTAGQ